MSINIIHSTSHTAENSEWELCLQWCEFPGGEKGYRFIWKQNREEKNYPLQSRLPSFTTIKKLMDQAADAGWGDKQGNE